MLMPVVVHLLSLVCNDASTCFPRRRSFFSPYLEAGAYEGRRCEYRKIFLTRIQSVNLLRNFSRDISAAVCVFSILTASNISFVNVCCSVGKNYTLMCDNESERTEWFKSIREAQGIVSNVVSGSSSVNKGQFQLLVDELEETPANATTSKELLEIFSRFEDLFGKTSSRYVSCLHMHYLSYLLIFAEAQAFSMVKIP